MDFSGLVLEEEVKWYGIYMEKIRTNVSLSKDI
jgi:hypothetical protein